MDNKAEYTPLMEQYLRIKNEYKDALLFFRLGDFYELFYNDAKCASEILGLTLTSRYKGETPIPMCGIPHFVATTYISKLLREGYKVAICEQVGEVKPGKLVERKVTRVITPGTSLDSIKEINVEENFVCSIFPSDEKLGIAILDVSTGNLFLYEGKYENIQYLVSIYPISEIIIPDSFTKEQFTDKIFVTKKPLFWFNKDESLSLLKDFFAITQLDSLGFNDYPIAIYALGFLIKYLKEQFLDTLPKIFKIEWVNLEGRVFVSKQTYQSLEIFESSEGNTNTALFDILNKTLTPMGYRKLKNWLRTTTNDIVELNERLNAIEELTQSKNSLNEIATNLKNLCDIEKLTIKITTNNITPQEILSIYNAIQKIEQLQTILSNLKSGYFAKVLTYIKNTTDEVDNKIAKLKDFIYQYIDTPQKFDWYIKKGINRELDELKEFYLNSNKWLESYLETEKQRTNIPTLKIGYNDVFGYYIEITRTKSGLVPQHYIRKQTLKNVERYITAELKEFEVKFIRCKEKIEEIEKESFQHFLVELKKYCEYLHTIADSIAILDVLQSLASVSLELNWHKPTLTTENVLHLQSARHPVLEKFLGKKFIPNDIDINQQNYFLLITGPNMAGKSTLIKQVALIVFLAHIGSFVPAQNAKIGLTDAIFTRLTTKDMVSSGKSTFLVEMLECATILNLATERSFVIMDEIGRGTSTYDGLALAFSIIDYMVNKIKCRTLFATHYHELITLENEFRGLQNFHMSVYEWEQELVFLYKLQRGAIDRSFGIYVAKMAGIPLQVINNAKNLLSKIERKTSRELTNIFSTYKISQLPLLSQNSEKIITKLKKINYNNLTPIEALMKLKELKELLNE